MFLNNCCFVSEIFFIKKPMKTKNGISTSAMILSFMLF
uniref:Uncharacterized protein n=1 Tax=Anguilla anguilla TaxID=7936 RepID=A0A0E9SQ95_ANGAN